MTRNENALPEFAAVRVPSTDEPALVKRGETGYWPKPGLDVEAFNARHGITDDQREAMLAGSIFGFHVPAAQPSTYRKWREEKGRRVAGASR